MAQIQPIEVMLRPETEMKYMSGWNSKQAYLAGPIGPGGSEHNGPWRVEARAHLENKGIRVVEPLEATKYGIYEGGMDDVVARVLTERDKRFSTESQYLLANFTGATQRSMGTCIELGWADAAGTTIVTVMDDLNPHRHPIVESVSDYIVAELDDALGIISSLAADAFEEM